MSSGGNGSTEVVSLGSGAVMASAVVQSVCVCVDFVRDNRDHIL